MAVFLAAEGLFESSVAPRVFVFARFGTIEIGQNLVGSQMNIITR
jgi:hypothetical protein